MVVGLPVLRVNLDRAGEVGDRVLNLSRIQPPQTTRDECRRKVGGELDGGLNVLECPFLLSGGVRVGRVLEGLLGCAVTQGLAPDQIGFGQIGT